jgi:pimeloyl-ACP methyl ester carboxylesterase
MGAMLACIYAAIYPVSGVVDVDQPLCVRPFAEVAQRLERALKSDDFHAAFEPFRQSIGVDHPPEPERSRIVARQRISQDLVVAYWDEVFRATPGELQALSDSMLKLINAPFLGVFGHALEAREKQHLRRGLPPAEVEEWTERGHLVHSYTARLTR